MEKIIFSVLAHFWLNGFINKRNMRCQTTINTYSMSHHCIPKKLRFGAVYGPTASLDRTTSVMIKNRTLL